MGEEEGESFACFETLFPGVLMRRARKRIFCWTMRSCIRFLRGPAPEQGMGLVLMAMIGFLRSIFELAINSEKRESASDNAILQLLRRITTLSSALMHWDMIPSI